MFNINGILKIRNLSYKKELILKGFDNGANQQNYQQNQNANQQNQNANQQNYQQNQNANQQNNVPQVIREFIQKHPTIERVFSNQFFCLFSFIFVVFNFFFIILSVFLIIDCINCVKQFKDSKMMNYRQFLHGIKTNFSCYLLTFIIKYSFVLFQYFSTIQLLFVIPGFFLINFAPYRKRFPSRFESQEKACNPAVSMCCMLYSCFLVLVREFVPSVSHICAGIILSLIVLCTINPFVDFVIDSCIDKEKKVGRVTQMFLTFISFAWAGFLIILLTLQKTTNNIPDNQQNETINNTPDKQQENKVKEQKNKWFSWPKYVFIGLLGAGLVTFGLKKSKQLFVKKPKSKTFSFIPGIISAFLAFFKFDV